MADVRPIEIMSATDADLRYAVIKLAEALKALATKLDGDTGVTLETYASQLATYATIDATNHIVTPL